MPPKVSDVARVVGIARIGHTELKLARIIEAFIIAEWRIGSGC